MAKVRTCVRFSVAINTIGTKRYVIFKQLVDACWIIDVLITHLFDLLEQPKGNSNLDARLHDAGLHRHEALGISPTRRWVIAAGGDIFNIGISKGGVHRIQPLFQKLTKGPSPGHRTLAAADAPILRRVDRKSILIVR